ncbi:MAG: DsbE family thiol:disulfide interchange protein [Halieaceae bacterium]|nr:MAG: DsbE family thiol:disulfide interchange protein [Halieaceae bacterium]
MRVKKFIPLFAFVLLTGLLFRGLSIDPTALPAARLGQPFPPFAQPELLSGDEISDTALTPKPALVNVWATWCYSCRVEHPYLLSLAEQGIPIYGLNYKDDSAKARDWLEQLGDPYRLNIVDVEGSVGLDLGVYGAPETYVLDADGYIVHRHVGVLDEGVFTRDFSRWFPVGATSEPMPAAGEGL